MNHCWPWSHKWSKWTKKSAEAILYERYKNICVTRSWQERSCSVCGKVQQEPLPFFAAGKPQA